MYKYVHRYGIMLYCIAKINIGHHAVSSSILVRPLLQLLTTTTISWNKTEKIGVMILKVYMRINIVLLIVYPQFGKQSLLAPLIMSGVVRVRVSKSFRLRKEFQPPLRTQALQAH